MARHSKSNQIREFLTYEERARWVGIGTQSDRLGADSMRSFDSCCLCLQFAQRPMVTPAGYIYCRECIFENIVEQKNAHGRKMKEFEDQQRQEEAKEDGTKKMIENVETEVFAEQHDSILPANHSKVSEIRANKKQAISKLNEEGIQKAVNQSFWIPQHTPQYRPAKIPAPVCRVVDPMDSEQTMKIKQLVECHFTEQRELQATRATKGEGAAKTNITEGKYQCPSCSRTLSNAIKIAVLSKCGHVICQQCIDRFSVTSSSSPSSEALPPSSANRTDASKADVVDVDDDVEDKEKEGEPASKRAKRETIDGKEDGDAVTTLSSPSTATRGDGLYTCIVCSKPNSTKEIIRVKAAGTGYCGALEDPSKQIAKKHEVAGGFAAATSFYNSGANRKVTYRI